MRKFVFLSARFEEQHVQRLDEIAKVMGLNRSQIFRRLVEVAHVTPGRVTVELPGQNGSGADSHAHAQN